MIYISPNGNKAFLCEAVQAFDYYPQMINGQMKYTLRILLPGGDQWYEGPEASSLHSTLLALAQTNKMGSKNS